MGDDDGGVGKGGEQRPELLEMLGRLEHPPLAKPLPCTGALPFTGARPFTGALPLEYLEDGLQVGVVGGLVVGQVVVAPPRDARHPFELIAGEVRQLQLQLLMDVVGPHGVHGAHVRQHRLHALPLAFGPSVTGVGAVRPALLAGVGHRLVALPQRERTQAGVGGDEIDQMGGSRAGQAHDDDRRRDLDVGDLGATGEEIADA